MNKHKGSVVVGMSGGVDSSVSAYLLKKQGFDVKGLFMKNWQTEPGEECTSEIDYKDASKVCDQLDIPLHKANFSNEYWDNVFESFLSEHKKGRTPNPDILCNREIKFKSFLHYAEDIGADFIATGHYAKLINEDDHTYLARAVDDFKDQTYFLHEVNENQLKNCIFPLANLSKNEVRKIAADTNLPVAKKKDSVGICFIGERKFKDFLGQYLPAKPGIIESAEGDAVGHHDGLMYHTLGQRKGLRIGGLANAGEEPWYVVEKDLLRNVLIVGQGHNHPRLFSKGLIANQLHWVDRKALTTSIKCTVKTRYRQDDVSCTVTPIADSATGEYQIDFNEQQSSVTPGQSVVFYQDDVCLGGGIINSLIR